MAKEKIVKNNAEIEIDGLQGGHEETHSESKEVLHDRLIETIRRYRANTDLSMIEKAYDLACQAHEDQRRKSGEPYIIHPISTAIILAELELDKETIAAGLLHDVVEDTPYTKEQLEEMFGSDVAELVDGVTKLTRLNFDHDKVEEQAENLRKMFLAMAKDIRVILIKLADRLHNMRTLQFMKPEKQKEKARETMDIYSPLASRLGISKIKIELDDLALKYLEPEAYTDLYKQVKDRVANKEDFILSLVDQVKTDIKEAKIQGTVSGRVKHIFSIYKKMVNQNKTLDQIYDIFAVRIIVDSVRDCYAALGIMHEKYTPIPGRFKDYIAMPKPNMYQSLHTTLIGPTGQPFEVQIRTAEMHRTAEFGIAAHWKYKETGGSTQLANQSEEEKLSWLREILEWQKDMDDNKEFMKGLKNDLSLFSERVYCFTPNGDVKTLPNGSTPIDFAYAIHSAVGNKMVGASVNGKMVPIDYKLQNGDRVSITTSQNSKGPSLDWLNIVKSTQARNKINQWFKKELKEDNIAQGKELLEHYCKSHGIVLAGRYTPEDQKKIMNKYGFREWNALLAAIGHGSLKEGQVVNKLVEEIEKREKKNISDEDALVAMNSENIHPSNRSRKKSGITVHGLDDVAVRFSKCCSPVPGDEIVGFVTRGRGVSIHRTDCINVISLSETERARLIDAEWQEEAMNNSGEKYLAEINIFANNRTGLIADLSRLFSERNIDVQTINSRISKQGIATIGMSFEIFSVSELKQLVEKIRQIDGVFEIERTRG